MINLVHVIMTVDRVDEVVAKSMAYAWQLCTENEILRELEEMKRLKELSLEDWSFVDACLSAASGNLLTSVVISRYGGENARIARRETASLLVFSFFSLFCAEHDLETNLKKSFHFQRVTYRKTFVRNCIETINTMLYFAEEERAAANVVDITVSTTVDTASLLSSCGISLKEFPHPTPKPNTDLIIP